MQEYIPRAKHKVFYHRKKKLFHLVECHRTSSPGGELDQVQCSLELSRLGIHSSGLENIKRLGHGGRDGSL